MHHPTLGILFQIDVAEKAILLRHLGGHGGLAYSKHGAVKRDRVLRRRRFEWGVVRGALRRWNEFWNKVKGARERASP